MENRGFWNWRYIFQELDLYGEWVINEYPMYVNFAEQLSQQKIKRGRFLLDKRMIDLLCCLYGGFVCNATRKFSAIKFLGQWILHITGILLKSYGFVFYYLHWIIYLYLFVQNLNVITKTSLGPGVWWILCSFWFLVLEWM